MYYKIPSAFAPTSTNIINGANLDEITSSDLPTVHMRNVLKIVKLQLFHRRWGVDMLADLNDGFEAAAQSANLDSFAAFPESLAHS